MTPRRRRFKSDRQRKAVMAKLHPRTKIIVVTPRNEESYKGYSHEIGKIVNVHQLDILARTIEGGFNECELTYPDVQKLSLELNERAEAS